MASRKPGWKPSDDVRSNGGDPGGHGGDQPDAHPTGAELDACMAVLRRLGARIEQPDYAELNELGKSVWRRAIIKERFGEQDVVAFLKESHKHKQMLKKLERLQVAVLRVHDERVQEAAGCEINVQRAEDSLIIAAESTALRDEQGLLPLSAHQKHELMTHRKLADSKRKLKTNMEQQRKEKQQGSQHLALADPAAGPDSAPMSWVTSREFKRAELGRAQEARAEEEPEAQPPAAEDASAGEAEPQVDMAKLEKAASIPVGSLRRYCACCKEPFEKLHSFYHQLCGGCAVLNFEKRKQSADMEGMVAIVTGGRVRIGFHIALKLLRAGATVLVTSRYPNDALGRYAVMDDYSSWSSRLQVCMCPMELADVKGVEAFTAEMGQRFERIHILINNAAQTLTRSAGWSVRMAQLEHSAAVNLPPSTECSQLHLPEVTRQSVMMPISMGAQTPRVDITPAVDGQQQNQEDQDQEQKQGERAAGAAGSEGASQMHTSTAGAYEQGVLLPVSASELAAFPAGVLDESRQPLDLSRNNSWSRQLGTVDTTELMHTMAANAVAPFVLCGKLLPLLSPSPTAAAGSVDAAWGHIINVSALEGKFAVGKKSTRHPQTNMSKAALNMLTFTCARDYYQKSVLVNAVDTGWVTDNAPGGLGAKATTHETHVAPPLDEDDGASRVLDPIFRHLNSKDRAFKQHGFFWKDYEVSSW